MNDKQTIQEFSTILGIKVIQRSIIMFTLHYLKSDQLEEETSVSKSFLLIFDYFTLVLIVKNIETNLPKRKHIQKDMFT